LPPAERVLRGSKNGQQWQDSERVSSNTGCSPASQPATGKSEREQGELAATSTPPIAGSRGRRGENERENYYSRKTLVLRVDGAGRTGPVSPWGGLDEKFPLPSFSPTRALRRRAGLRGRADARASQKEQKPAAEDLRTRLHSHARTHACFSSFPISSVKFGGRECAAHSACSQRPFDGGRGAAGVLGGCYVCRPRQPAAGGEGRRERREEGGEKGVGRRATAATAATTKRRRIGSGI
jgi:hypothetical protein